ncbi:hypothetical protein OSB04_030937 [Centaurea solstitialis]|uniref:Reverse transcriptase RNase H-like domain-containing protein n=1 Tax=Centaurea solstitialis TaxID=347529 RepID=A0AA38W5H3_9ASTR|nr:hypothetical protein OSB04_030937 [Centaurea solstitialis]
MTLDQEEQEADNGSKSESESESGEEEKSSPEQYHKVVVSNKNGSSVDQHGQAKGLRSNANGIPKNQLMDVKASTSKLHPKKELVATVLAVWKWRPYLLGRHFAVRSDQQSLRCLLERVVEPEYQRWMSKLLGYNFSIVYKPRSVNKVAEALSRKDVEIECSNVGVPQWRQWDSLREELEDYEF